MSVSRRGEKTYTGFNGAREQVLRDKAKLRHEPAGIAGRVAPPSRDALRRFIAEQICPWCGSGPWTVLAGHTSKTHGVSAAELRDLAGLIKDARVCDPDYGDLRAQMSREAGFAERARQAEPWKRPRTFSEAGRAVQREKAAKVRDPHKGAAARVAKTMTANAPKYAEAVRMFDEGAPLVEIGAAVGLHPRTVANALRRAGRDVAAAHAVRAAARVTSPEVAQARRDAVSAAEAGRWAKRAAEYVALGQNWAAIHILAGREGVTAKTLRQGLINHGATVPDGRSDPTSPKGRATKRVYPDRKPCAKCGKPSVARGLCDTHYRRARKAASA